MKKNIKPKRSSLLCAVGVLVAVVMSGCAGLSLTEETVLFNDPYTILKVEEMTANSEEAGGVLLRFRAPQSGVLSYNEQTVMFAQIKGDEGKCLRLDNLRHDTYSSGESDSSFIVASEMNVTGSDKKIFTSIEISDRGEILRLLDSTHKTKIGKFIFDSWTRTAMFPEERVQIGDEWTYDEAINMRIESWLIKDRGRKPFAIKARSTLEGFALCQGVRCAVIKTTIVKDQEYSFRILFKNIDFRVRTRIDETTYFDYAGGRIIGEVVQDLGQTTTGNPPTTETSQGQSVIVLKQIETVE